jgi:hypothetical protein
MTHISEKLVHTTVRLLTYDSNNNSSAGTGFFFKFEYGDDGFVPMLITNRHMLATGMRAEVCITHDENGAPKYGSYERYTIIDLQKCVVYHPERSVDLAAIYMGGILNDMASKGRKPYYVLVQQEDLPSDAELASMTTFEEVVMVGYPNGIWDSKNNLPIARRGYTATPFSRDYEGRKEFLIDAACFPGSSGSPVFLYNSGPFATSSGISIGHRCKLLGIIYAGPVQTQRGTIVVEPIPTAHQLVSISRNPVHLGFCIKSSEIMALSPKIRAKIMQGMPQAEAAEQDPVAP